MGQQNHRSFVPYRGRSSVPPYLSFFDNDDFIAPHRFLVIRDILTDKPEIDLLLSGYHGTIVEPTFHQVTDVIAAHWEKARPTKKDLTRWKDYGLEGYDEIYNTMERSNILRWRLGSLEYEPLLADVGGQAEALAELDRLFLDTWPQGLGVELKEDTENEYEWLKLITHTTPPGRGWGDAPAADGWSTIRAKVLAIIPPPVAMWWGEDALYNWRIAAAGLNYKHFVYGFEGGSYVRWKEKETLLKSAYPPTSSPEDLIADPLWI